MAALKLPASFQTPKVKASFAQTAQKAALQKLSPIARAATRTATKTGKPVNYVGGSGKVGVSGGVANPLPKISDFGKTKGNTGTSAMSAAAARGGGGNGMNDGLKMLADALANFKFPEPPDPQFAPGGASANIDTNASGFRRKKSSARTLGLTSKGTGQFKIAGQSAKSSGLNIGV